MMSVTHPGHCRSLSSGQCALETRTATIGESWGYRGDGQAGLWSRDRFRAKCFLFRQAAFLSTRSCPHVHNAYKQTPASCLPQAGDRPPSLPPPAHPPSPSLPSTPFSTRSPHPTPLLSQVNCYPDLVVFTQHSVVREKACFASRILFLKGV